MALNLAPFGRWTLRDKAAQRRLALRYTSERTHPFVMIQQFKNYLSRLQAGLSESLRMIFYWSLMRGQIERPDD